MESDKVYSKKNYIAFNPKLLNTLKLNHPYYKIARYYFDHYYFYLEDYDANIEERDVVKEGGYFEILDNFYRCGYTFSDDLILPKNIVELKFIIELINNQSCYFYINLDECDTGELTLSAIEKWKRKVIHEEKDKKTKLALLKPKIYNSLITFYIFSNFKNRPSLPILFEDSFFPNFSSKWTYQDKKSYEDKYYMKKVLQKLKTHEIFSSFKNVYFRKIYVVNLFLVFPPLSY